MDRFLIHEIMIGLMLEKFTYIARGDLISLLNLAYLRHETPILRSPSNPKKLIILNKFVGSNDTAN